MFVIDLARLWFSGEKNRQEIARDLNVRFGYFKGCKVSRSIDELFSFIFLYQPLVLVNPSNFMRVSNDERRIAQLVFPAFNSYKKSFEIAQSFVPKTEIEKLLNLAKIANYSLKQRF